VLLALLVAVSSVLLGAAISFVPTSSRAVLGYLRTFATLAAVAVVVVHLLPEALAELGALAIPLFLAGWFVPRLAHFVGQRSTSGRAQHAVLEAGYWGLLVHHLADGIGLGTYTRLPSELGGSHLDVVVALAAHTVPLIAVVSLAYRTTFGARSALLRSLGLALASVLGVCASSLVGARTIEGFAPLISALAAGLLLHVVTHDLTEDPAQSALARSLDLIAAVLGVAVSLIGVWRHVDPGTREFSHGLLELCERTALVILVALAVQAFTLRLPDRSSKWAVAALPAGLLGADGVLLSIALFGFASAAVRLLGIVLALAFLVSASADPSNRPALGQHWRARASETLESSGPWLALGLLIAALLLSVPAAAISQRLSGTLLELALVALVANLTPAAAPAALLIAVGFGGIGLSASAALLFATLAPITRSLGSGLKARGLATVIACLVAALCSRLGLSAAPVDGALSGADLGPRAASALCALLLLGVWQRSARLWLSNIVPPPPHEYEHAHDVHGPHAH
jgi:hypothetical protein